MQASELRNKSVEELNEELVALRREQFNLRMSQSTGELNNHTEHKRVRKAIARVKTVLTEKSGTAGDE